MEIFVVNEDSPINPLGTRDSDPPLRTTLKSQSRREVKEENG